MNELQATLPQAQSVGLDNFPFELGHVSPREHVLVGKLQYNPEVFVQVEVPQKHWAGFAVLPVVCAQFGAVTQRQESELPWQFLVNPPDNVLNFKDPSSHWVAQFLYEM